MTLAVVLQIIHRTPPWVFILFFVLLGLGLVQTRNRKVPEKAVILLPGAMTGLALYSVVSAFGGTLVTIACWLAGVALAGFVNSFWISTQGVVYSIESRKFFIPGSWLPCGLMMAIFFTRYATGIIAARQPALAATPVYILTMSLLYGLFAGMFLARSLQLRRLTHRG